MLAGDLTLLYFSLPLPLATAGLFPLSSPTSPLHCAPIRYYLAHPAFSAHLTCPSSSFTKGRRIWLPFPSQPPLTSATHPGLPGPSTSTGHTRTVLRVHANGRQGSSLQTRSRTHNWWAILPSGRLRWNLEPGLKPSSDTQPALCPSHLTTSGSLGPR